MSLAELTTRELTNRAIQANIVTPGDRFIGGRAAAASEFQTQFLRAEVDSEARLKLEADLKLELNRACRERRLDGLSSSAARYISGRMTFLADALLVLDHEVRAEA